jgi:Flp pilus assembly protein TadD
LECDVYHREAKLLIDGSPPVDDPRLLVLRGRALGGMRKNFAADVEYATALTLLPDDSQVRAEAHRNSAYSAIGRRDWRRAREEFSKACELMPDDVVLSNCEAVAALAAGDADGYRATCSRMLSRFGEDIDRETAHQVVWACTLRGDAVADFDRVVPLARMAVLSHHDGAGVLLAALYRAGNFEEAIACFDAATMMYRPTAWDWTFAAMAHHRLGQTERASRCLAEAGGWIQAADRQTDVDLGGVLPCWGSWRTPIAYRLLLREAKQMMETEADVGGLE